MRGLIVIKRLGVIGGLGPIATAYFYELVIKMTMAETDQEHIEMLILSKPAIPDRTKYILGLSKESPVEPIIAAGKQLSGLGADQIAIPCITAHYFYDALSKGIKTPVIHAIRETAKYLKDRGVTCAGIMATEGTIFSGLFQRELNNYGIHPVIPTWEYQAMVTDLIYKDVKANRPVEFDKFQAVSEQLRQDGAEVIILGCSELSLIKRDFEIGAGYIDAMEVLAMRCVQLCGARLKKEYEALISWDAADIYFK